MNTANANTDSSSSSRGEGEVSPPPPANGGGGGPGPPEQLASRAGNTVFKSGPLFISSKGIGWTSWKKRWFILTRTSLVFFRSDPNAVPQKGSEVNLTLGGIDLNNSGSVVVKADKKLLTVLFPGGREGRAFTLKAENMEDLNEWKDALELALSQAPNASLTTGQNGIFRNDQAEVADTSLEQPKDTLPKDTLPKDVQPTQPVESSIIGRPVLLALQEADGSPSFLEKALKFIEEYGVKVEGILRQAADVEDVERRVREYEQGKTEFTPDEDPHIIADCVKYVLREIPSGPVPALCCNALLEACKKDRGNRVTAMGAALRETLPEPNRWLLRRILTMMQIVASHKAENRMSPSAVAACMAPLLLRPLLAGDLELESDFDVGGDGSIQLLQAAAAANHAQAIVITLLEHADTILDEEGPSSPEIYSDSEGSECGSGSGSEEGSYDAESYESDGDDNASQDSYTATGDDGEHAYSGSSSRNGEHTGEDSDDDDKGSGGSEDSKTCIVDEADERCSRVSPKKLPEHENTRGSDADDDRDTTSVGCASASDSDLPVQDPPAEASTGRKMAEVSISENKKAHQAEQHSRVETSPEIKTSSSSPRVENPRTETNPEQHKILHQAKKPPGLETISETEIASQTKKTHTETVSECKIDDRSASSSLHITKYATLPTKAVNNARRLTVWGRTPGQKNLSMESIDCPFEEESELQKLEDAKSDLLSRVTEEGDGNAILRTTLEKQNEAFSSRKLALEQNMARLQEQLQRQRELRASMQAGAEMVKAGLEELALAESQFHDLKMRVDNLGISRQSYCLHQPGQQCKDLQKKASDKQTENENHVASKHLSTRKSARNKDNYVDRADHENQVPAAGQETKTSQNEKLDPTYVTPTLHFGRRTRVDTTRHRSRHRIWTRSSYEIPDPSIFVGYRVTHTTLFFRTSLM